MYRRHFCKLGAAAGALAIPKTAGALNLITRSSAKKWAVVYGSQCGSTREYANAINEGLGGIAEVIDIEKSTPKAGDYEFFIIGGWRSASSVKPNGIPTFITSNKDALKDKIKGLFVVVGNGGSTNIDSSITSFLKDKLITPAGASEEVGQVFLGRSVPSCNGFNMSYDNVDPEKGKTFGQKILADNTGIINPALGSPKGFGLTHSSNLFGRISSINYTLPQNANVLLTVCSINGQKLATLVSKHQSAGSYKVAWDGSYLAPGYYLYRLQAGGLVETRTAKIIN